MTTALYCKEPLALGTPAGEALTSILTRLAYDHRVNPRDLVREVLASHTSIRPLNYARFFETYAATINAHGHYAQTFVAALSEASGASQLTRATLLPWRTLFSPNGHPLVNSKRRWCSACWTEAVRNGGPPYDLLVWALAPVVRCPWHGTPLVDACPTCRRPQPIIPRLPVLTHCDHCHRPLSKKSKPGRPLAASDSAWLCAEFIQMRPTALGDDLADHLRVTLDRIISVIAHGNRAAFCRMAGMRPFALKNLFAKRERPSLQHVLRLLQAIDLRPSEVFASEMLPPRGVNATSPPTRSRPNTATLRLIGPLCHLFGS